MHVSFLIDSTDLRRWQAEAIASVLAATGASGTIATVAGPPPAGLLDLCLAFEALAFRRPRSGPLERLSPAALNLSTGAADADLVIDLAASTETVGDRLLITVGGFGVVAGAADAIMAGEEPFVDLVAVVGSERRLVGRWHVAVEDRRQLGSGMAIAAGRAIEMLTLAAGRLATGATLHDLRLPRVETEPPPHRPGQPALFAAAAFARALAARLERLVRTPPNWAVAWRADETGDGALPTIAGRPWRRLAGDGGRFYADPFVMRHGGRTVLFVEEFPFATQKGVISAVELGADGPVGTPRPVIETDCHLSYPFVFEEDGAVYMIPETSGRRRVELWRAVDFPDRWEKAATLIDDIDLGDATLFRADGRNYLFGTVRPHWGSSWDGLAIFTAERLAGPWAPLFAGPAKVDVASARPAGRMFSLGASIVRPFQDSVGGYGAGLGFARVDRLDAGGYAETTLMALRPAPPLSGLHTYNRGGGFEVIDVIADGGTAVVIP
ncbi:conserved hypothetical protein [uncultured Pleomorphomonas sp.]|uniref:Glucosamine inositolphosphorylceramide transferase 1 N-terminal domain-containing protein n=1 Tax=uncultured Pleomorphomonas sp. TaxID=442121 RepID=A0A212LJS3_9HYPH|nr:hypothetical protein [uncultured Pleomorphomonas sp.]SCM77801.1 conserved hypothetical protein [uncultured Pleomorphomonas sp.]